MVSKDLSFHFHPESVMWPGFEASQREPAWVHLDQIREGSLHRPKRRAPNDFSGWYTEHRQHDYPAATELSAQALEGLFGLLLTQISDLAAAVDSLTQRLRVSEDTIQELSERPRERLTEIPKLNSDSYALKRSIFVNIEEYDDETLARWPILDLTARGTSEHGALLAFQDALLDLFADLKEDPQSLGEAPRRWLSILDDILTIRA
jgi:hypothetical protein